MAGFNDLVQRQAAVANSLLGGHTCTYTRKQGGEPVTTTVMIDDDVDMPNPNDTMITKVTLATFLNHEVTAREGDRFTCALGGFELIQKVEQDNLDTTFTVRRV